MCVVYETGEGVLCSIHMPQAGFDPPAQSHVSCEASALPPSHHGWTEVWFNLVKFYIWFYMNVKLNCYNCKFVEIVKHV